MTPPTPSARSLLLFACGFAAGLCSPAACATSTDAGAQTPAAAGAGRRHARRRSPPAATLPDFSRIAERTVPAVVNISSLQVVRRAASPFDPFFRSSSATPTTSSARGAASRAASAPASSSAATATSSPTTTSSPASRGASRSSSSTSRVALADKREMRGDGHRRRSGHRPGAAQDRRAQPADDAVGRFVEAEGRRVGAGDRQPVSAQPDRDARHRLGASAAPTSASRPTRTSSRPTPPSTPATPAARWSTRAASWSASTPPSSARAAATRASASPSRATWRGASSTTCSSTAKCAAARSATSRSRRSTPQMAAGARRRRTRTGVLVHADAAGRRSAFTAGLRPGDVIVLQRHGGRPTPASCRG